MGGAGARPGAADRATARSRVYGHVGAFGIGSGSAGGCGGSIAAAPIPLPRSRQAGRPHPIALNDRVAFIGKSWSGKTTAALELVRGAAASIVADERAGNRSDPPWRVVAIDSKRSAEDQPRFEAIGPICEDRAAVWRAARPGAVYRPPWDPETGSVEPIQAIAEEAYRRGNVLLYCDEYREAVVSTVFAGRSLLRVFQQGRGRNVGLWGATQEPVYVPRQLLSQATHVLLFDLFYPPDQDVARALNPDWQRPPDDHGFYYLHVDGRGSWLYFRNKDEFARSLLSMDDFPHSPR